MESMTDISIFLAHDIGNSYGRGDGSGSGDGNGRGDGSGSGSGYGRGSGSGYGSGYGNCNGSGYGRGDGSGSGYGSGYGRGSGSGYGLISFAGYRVYYIDKVPTCIEKVKCNLAKGFIIKGDLTTENCYVVRSGSLFAHGRTLEDARKALQHKIFNAMDVDEKIDLFLKKFNLTDEYPAKDFYEWHHILTGSCEMGRNAFVKNHGIDLENDKYTVREFIDLTKDDYGGGIIKTIEERLSE